MNIVLFLELIVTGMITYSTEMSRKKLDSPLYVELQVVEIFFELVHKQSTYKYKSLLRPQQRLTHTIIVFFSSYNM